MKDFSGKTIHIGDKVTFKLKNCYLQFYDLVFQIYDDIGMVQLSKYHDKIYLAECDYFFIK